MSEGKNPFSVVGPTSEGFMTRGVRQGLRVWGGGWWPSNGVAGEWMRSLSRFGIRWQPPASRLGTVSVCKTRT